MKEAFDSGTEPTDGSYFRHLGSTVFYNYESMPFKNIT